MLNWSKKFIESWNFANAVSNSFRSLCLRREIRKTNHENYNLRNFCPIKENTQKIFASAQNTKSMPNANSTILSKCVHLEHHQIFTTKVLFCQKSNIKHFNEN